MLSKNFQECFLKGIPIDFNKESFDLLSMFYISGCVEVVFDALEKNTFSKDKLYTMLSTFLNIEDGLIKKSA